MKNGDLFMWYEEGASTKEMLYISDMIIIDIKTGDRYSESDIKDYEIDFENIKSIKE